MTLKLVAAKQAEADPSKPSTFSADLRLSYHAAMLAVTMYVHHAQLYDLLEKSWVDLPGEEKREWIDKAAEWLRDEAPPKCLMGCGNYAQPGSEYCNDPTCSIQAETERD